jgi:2-hydroxy-3-keto-5-methylthiopentenyl-1-phosphate phosphatase
MLMATPGKLGGSMPLRVLCDFDGTVSVTDTTDAIFDRFAPDWRSIETLWEAGGIGSAECMRRQVELMDASEADLNQALDDLRIDPGFPAFVRFCDEAKIGLTIVSDGVDYFIRRILNKAGLSKLAIYANQLIKLGERSYTLRHPYKTADCAAGAGTCKCARASSSLGRPYTILIGDGRSDFCVSHQASAVFAKKSLLQYTRAEGIEAFEYATFADVQAVFDRLLVSTRAGRAPGYSGSEVSA